MTQNINYQTNEPDLIDVLHAFGKDLGLAFNCHHIGTVQTFDPLTQTAEVSINYVKTFLDINTPESQQNNQQSVGATTIRNQEYPILVTAPVICLGGGTGTLTFPITQGDECLVLFNDRDMDNWFAGSSNSQPATPRLHAFSDAIILVGLRSLPKVIADYDDDAVAIRMGANYLKVFEDKITGGIGEDVTVSLNADEAIITIDQTVFKLTKGGKLSITNSTAEFVSALSQLFQDVFDGRTTTMLGPMPLVMPTFFADKAKLDSFKE